MESLITRKSRTCCRSQLDRKSTRLNSSHSQISYAVFCLKKKKKRFTARLPAAHTFVVQHVYQTLQLAPAEAGYGRIANVKVHRVLHTELRRRFLCARVQH